MSKAMAQSNRNISNLLNSRQMDYGNQIEVQKNKFKDSLDNPLFTDKPEAATKKLISSKEKVSMFHIP